MQPFRRTTRARSLAAINQGETVEVGDILFDGVRALCESAGIRPGVRLHCRQATPTQLLLETDAGRVANLDRCYAQFVETSLTVGTRLSA